MLRYVSNFKDGAFVITRNTDSALRIGCEGPYEKNGVNKAQLLELLDLLKTQNTVLQELDLRCNLLNSFTFSVFPNNLTTIGHDCY